MLSLWSELHWSSEPQSMSRTMRSLPLESRSNSRRLFGYQVSRWPEVHIGLGLGFSSPLTCTVHCWLGNFSSWDLTESNSSACRIYTHLTSCLRWCGCPALVCVRVWMSLLALENQCPFTTSKVWLSFIVKSFPECSICIGVFWLRYMIPS